MATVLCFNPGSNSLKVDLVEVREGATRACEGTRLATATVDDAEDFGAAVGTALAKVDTSRVELVGVRVVHGGDRFSSAVRFDEDVRREIVDREALAPLHNARSLEVIDALTEHTWPVFVAFDTAFHRTLPEVAWRYPIDPAIADAHGVRKFGFHGLSHAYLVEQYARVTQRDRATSNLVTMHLESGCSVAAIERGRSVDTSMGMTPLEGLMMGTRSGSVDPAIVPFLVKRMGVSVDEALDVLEKRSGLRAISGVSLDTRVLRKRDDARSRLALDMFGYRVRKAVGAHLAVLGRADAIVFGGGIGENTPEVRRAVCEGLTGFGLRLDERANDATMTGDVCITTPDSALAAWVLNTDEARQLAYECARVR